MPRTGRFNKPPGMRPCPLYTPPVALTDGLLCEFEGLNVRVYACAPRKLNRTVWSKGKRSRNKASVGEPADGSLRVISKFSHLRDQRVWLHVCVSLVSLRVRVPSY